MDRRFFLAGAAALAFAPAAHAELNFAAAARYSAERRGVSLLVQHRGRTIFEEYPNGGAAARAWALASGTKSFTGIMVAAAVQDGLLTLDEPCARTLTEWSADGRRDITIRHLLSLTSGIRPGAIGTPPTYAEAVTMPLVSVPGERFAYGPSPFQAFGELMRRKLDSDPLAYLERRVLDRIEVSFEFWRRGPDGNPLMPQGCVMSAREWAKFGQFVQGGGRVGGRAILDPQTLAECFVPSHANPGYGVSWWLLRPGLVRPTGETNAALTPEAVHALGDVRMAAGAGDQRLFLMPERELVVTRQATFIGMQTSPAWSDGEFLRLLLSPSDR